MLEKMWRVDLPSIGTETGIMLNSRLRFIKLATSQNMSANFKEDARRANKTNLSLERGWKLSCFPSKGENKSEAVVKSAYRQT
jgi:hypothetical protein